MLVKDAITEHMLEFSDYRHGFEVAKQARCMFEKTKNKDVEDLTIKEIKALAPILVNQVSYYDTDESSWMGVATKRLIMANKK